MPAARTANALEAERRYREANRETLRARARESARRYREAHPEKVRERVREWHRANRERMRDWRLTTKYGISTVVYDAMVSAQGGLCAICERPRPLVVDHDHTQSVNEGTRALLCSECNTALGKFEDSPARLIRAAEYLTNYGKRKK